MRARVLRHRCRGGALADLGHELHKLAIAAQRKRPVVKSEISLIELDRRVFENELVEAPR